jgi:hypothetical protein
VNAKDGLILWTLGAAGSLLIYSAYKNHSPAETLKGYFTNTPSISNPVSRTYDIKGPGYTTTDGVNTRSLPVGYQSNGKNYIPLHGARPY